VLVFRLLTLFSVIVCGAVISGCDSASTDDESGVVVEAYLEAGASFGRVRLSRAAPIDQRYDFSQAAVGGAMVEIRRLGASDVVEEVTSHIESNDQPGVYLASGDHIVQPLATYELVVITGEPGETVRSRTTVPGAFSIIDSTPDTVVYQGPTQVEVTMTRSTYPGRQAIFVFSTESLDPSIESLTPFYREVVEPDNDGDDDELDDILINESPPLNEDAYQIDDMGGASEALQFMADEIHAVTGTLLG